MRFRPCIDIHNGKVKQIVGVSLEESTEKAQENFVSEHDAAWFAEFYAKDDLSGGHIIMLNRGSSPEYMPSKEAAMRALKAVPGMFQAGGGITPYNADEFLDAGASKVIVTSYVFQDGCFNERHLNKMTAAVGRERLVLDLSCRKSGESYFIVTDHWTKFTNVELTPETLQELAGSCSEFLIHAVDAAGPRSGPELPLVDILAQAPITATYAGGVASFSDLEDLRIHGRDRVDVTIGSALDIFGGNMPYREVLSRLG